MDGQQTFQPAQGFQAQAPGGFGLQMPQIGFQGLQQPAFQAQPLQFQAPQLGFDQQQSAGYQPGSEPTTFTIGIPGGFQFAADPSQVQAYTPGGAVSPYREPTAGLRTRDAGLATKKPKKKSCLCC